MKTGSSGVPKTILTRETDSSDTFTGDLSTLVKNENEIAVFYPAAAITATSSDTLTQTLNLSGQDGTLAGITNYDYSWALCKASMNETTGSSACEMTSLVTIGKFQFTANGDSPLNNITRITVTATAGNLYSSAVMKLKDGEFSSTQTGNITIKNKTGISGTTYISFFPSEAQLHFTLVTTTGEVYETATSTTIKLEKGKVYEAPTLTCTLLPSAKVGDYYSVSYTHLDVYKRQAFVEAQGGTLFLDEIGNLSYEVQIQLRRALQERRIRPVGSNKEIEVDVRLVSATNENLQQAIEKGNFREDLYHRINEFTLRMPALKERQEDILLFANFFLDQANRELDRQLIGFDAAASQALQTYSWPGNLRQLKNIVKRATLLAQSNFITLAELGYELQEPVMSASPQTFSLHDEAAEKKRILEALKQTGNNKSKAAILLGIDRKTLYNKLKLYDIQ